MYVSRFEPYLVFICDIKKNYVCSEVVGRLLPYSLLALELGAQGKLISCSPTLGGPVYLKTAKISLKVKVGPQSDCNTRSVLRRQSRDTNRNIKRSVYCQYGWYIPTFRALALRQRKTFEHWPSEKKDQCFRALALREKGPTLETLDYTIRIGSTPTFLYFDLTVIQVI